VSYSNPSDVTITITGSVKEGQVFYANEKIDPGTVVGKTAPTATVTYHYATLIGGKEVSFADGTLKKKSALLANSTGTTAGAASLTDQALQPVLARAIASWRAAGG